MSLAAVIIVSWLLAGVVMGVMFGKGIDRMGK